MFFSDNNFLSSLLYTEANVEEILNWYLRLDNKRGCVVEWQVCADWLVWCLWTWTWRKAVLWGGGRGLVLWPVSEDVWTAEQGEQGGETDTPRIHCHTNTLTTRVNTQQNMIQHWCITKVHLTVHTYLTSDPLHCCTLYQISFLFWLWLSCWIWQKLVR